jgi:xylose isomerase
MDAFAFGLKAAEAIIEDGRLDKFVANRYASYKSGIGAEILADRADLNTLEQYALGLKEVKMASGRQEYLENLLNGIILSI